MRELTLAERLKAMGWPETNPWMPVLCLLGLVVSWWFWRRVERRFAELRALDELGDDPEDPWLEAQRIVAWLALLYFGFVSSFVVVAVVGGVVQWLRWWLLPVVAWAGWRWWDARRAAREAARGDDGEDA
jgi:hypothetical protein